MNGHNHSTTTATVTTNIDGTHSTTINGTTTTTTMNGSNGNHHTLTKEDIATTTTTMKKVETTYEILQRWYKLLFTKEDYLHHHKVIGILCLTSFVLRFLSLFIYDDMGFVAFPALTIPTLLLHTMLSLSSFQFKIPIRRIRDGGRIWPQYRYHSMIFSMRSILLLAVRYYEDQMIAQNNNNNNSERYYILNYIIIMGVMASAEYVNYMVGDEQRSNTIRELDGNAYTKFLFSTMQFNSIAVFLMGMPYYALPYYALFTIQLTPFIGTLRRKLIFTSNFWGAVLYGGLLLGGFTIQTYYYYTTGGELLHLFGRNIGLYAALLRFTDVLPKSMSIVQNKFVIWTIMYAIIHYCRSMNYENISIVHLRISLIIVILLLCATAYHKVQSGYYPKDVKHAKVMKSTTAIKSN